jgi:hypothetical protein
MLNHQAQLERGDKMQLLNCQLELAIKRVAVIISAFSHIGDVHAIQPPFSAFSIYYYYTMKFYPRQEFLRTE